MEAQLQIRQEAQEKQDVLKDLLRWQPETQRRSGAKAASSIRSAGPAVPGKQEGLAPLRSSSSSQGKPGLQSSAPYTLRESVKKNAQANKGSAAGHTYDKASSKWDKFDYDAALAQADSENSGQNQSFSFPKGAKPAASIPRKANPPASPGPEPRQKNLPVAPAEPTDAELWKDRGNKAFAAKKYAQAKKDYTQSIALQPTCIAFANRAMAELKLDELSAAESDCTEAIALDPSYVKAYLRRATAAKQLGKLQAAVEDYEQALRLEPTSKATVADRQTCLDQVLLQEGLQSELPRVAIPIGHERTLRQPSVSGTTPKGAAPELHEPSSSASGTSTAVPSKAVEQQQAVPALKQGRQEPSGGQKLPDKSAQGPQQQPAPQQDLSGPSSSRQNGHHIPPAAAHAGSSHRLPLQRRRGEPTVVIEELPPDEEEPPKPRVSSQASSGRQQLPVSSSINQALNPKSHSHASTAAPGAALASDPMPSAATSPAVANASVSSSVGQSDAAALQQGPLSPPAAGMQAAASSAAQLQQTSASGSDTGKQDSTQPAGTSQKLWPNSMTDQAASADTGSSSSAAAQVSTPTESSSDAKLPRNSSATSHKPAVSADTPQAGGSSPALTSSREASVQPELKSAAPQAAPQRVSQSVSTIPSGLLSASHSSQQATLHANGVATAAAPQANGHAVKQQQQQQHARQAAQQASSVAQEVHAEAQKAVPAKAQAGNSTGMSLSAPRSGSEFEVGWKRLKGNAAGQEAFLRLLDPMQLPALFKQSLTVPVLCGIALTALSMILTQSDHFGIQLLENLKSVPRFDMIVMSLPRREKSALKEQFDAAQSAGVLDSVVEKRLQVARRSYRV